MKKRVYKEIVEIDNLNSNITQCLRGFKVNSWRIARQMVQKFQV